MDTPANTAGITLPNEKTSKIMRIFSSTLGTMFHVLPNGKTCHFINGEYLTDIASEIKYYENEIELGHPHIYINAKRKEIDVNADPLAEVKKRAIADYIAAQNKATQRSTDPSRDMGTSDNSGGKGTGIVNSTSGGTINASKFAAVKTEGNGAQLMKTTQVKIPSTSSPAPAAPVSEVKFDADPK